MKAKKLRVATMAALCLCVLLLLEERQLVAAMSEYCKCYRECYSECRHDAPPPREDRLCQRRHPRDCLNTDGRRE